MRAFCVKHNTALSVCMWVCCCVGVRPLVNDITSISQFQFIFNESVLACQRSEGNYRYSGDFKGEFDENSLRSPGLVNWDPWHSSGHQLNAEPSFSIQFDLILLNSLRSSFRIELWNARTEPNPSTTHRIRCTCENSFAMNRLSKYRNLNTENESIERANFAIKMKLLIFSWPRSKDNSFPGGKTYDGIHALHLIRPNEWHDWIFPFGSFGRHDSMLKL